MQPTEGTRQHILQLLQGNGGATVAELAHEIGLAPASVRRHLDILLRHHLVDYRPTKKPTGRPEHVYFLTEAGQEALPKGYAQLLTSLINEIAALDVRDVRHASGHQLLEAALKRVARQVATQACRDSNGAVEKRLGWLVQELRGRGFRPQVDVAEDGIVIRLLNCPFRVAAMAHRAVCTFDRELIASLLQRDVIKEQCIHEGDFTCSYKAKAVAPRPTP